MTTLREAAQQALEALTSFAYHGSAEGWWDAVNDLRAALEQPEQEPFQPDWDRVQALQESLREHMAEIHRLRAALEQEQEQEQEPVAYLWQHSETGRTRVVMPDQVVTADATWFVVGPLYTHPPREWKGLTVDDGEEP